MPAFQLNVRALADQDSTGTAASAAQELLKLMARLSQLSRVLPLTSSIGEEVGPFHYEALEDYRRTPRWLYYRVPDAYQLTGTVRCNGHRAGTLARIVQIGD
jgi:hypothetical protein